MATTSIRFEETPRIRQLLALADDALILGHRTGEWTGHAPTLEEELALANIALDLIGQARALYQATLRQASLTLASFDRVAGSADRLLGDEGNSLARQMRDTLRSAQGAADQLKATLGDAGPAAKQLSATTLPAADAALRELRSTTRALRNITEKIDEQGAGALAGNSKLPDYEP